MPACPDCGAENPENTAYCLRCSSLLVDPASAEPEAPRYEPADAPAGDGTGGIIPYRNMPALLAYYFGIFSVLFGPLSGVPAVVLGIVGLQKRKQEPHVKGSVHAWIGIGCGALSTLATIAFVVFLFYAGR
jgi:hypothetical protein